MHVVSEEPEVVFEKIPKCVKKLSKFIAMSGDLWFPSYKTELQNRVTYYDVANRVTNSNSF